MKPKTTSEEGQELIKGYEQLMLVAYLPTPDDVPTTGWGTTQGVKMGDVIDVETAQAWFERDLRIFEACVNDSVEVELTQHQFDACVSLCYNIGCKAFRTSTLVRLLNEGAKPDVVALQFIRWNKQAGKVLKGLTRRREAETRLFLS